MKRSFNKLFISIIGVFSLCGFLLTQTSCSPISGDSVIEALMPNLWVFLSHLFATVVLITLCIWLVWKPSKDSLKKRHDYIQDQINQAEEARQESLKKLAEAQKERMAAHTHAKNILDVANNQAYQLKEKIENEAKSNAKKITDDAINEGVKIKASLSQKMDQEILDIAFDASSALLKSKVTREDSDKFVKDFIKEIKKSKKEGK